MNGAPLLAATCVAIGAALLVPGRPRLTEPATASTVTGADKGWMRRWRPVWSALAGAAAATALSGPVAVVGAPAVAALVWVLISRAETPAVRRDRETARRELPHLVGLLADALRAGQSPTESIALVTAALPGPAADRFAVAVPRLRLGVDPRTVWAGLADDPALAPLGRVLARAEATGAPVVRAVERLAEALADDVRGDVEDRARAVGVKAAVPLGLCLLPSFVLLGIVPVVAGLLGTVGL